MIPVMCGDGCRNLKFEIYIEDEGDYIAVCCVCNRQWEPEL